MSYAHTAAIVVAAIAAPNVANATSTVTADPIMVADVVKMTTDLVNAITYGSAKGAKQLTPQQQSTLKFGVQILVQKALASGMTWRELMFALAKGVGKSEAGILGRAVGNYISVIAYEYWAAAGAAWNSVTLPSPSSTSCTGLKDAPVAIQAWLSTTKTSTCPTLTPTTGPHRVKTTPTVTTPTTLPEKVAKTDGPSRGMLTEAVVVAVAEAAAVVKEAT